MYTFLTPLLAGKKARHILTTLRDSHSFRLYVSQQISDYCGNLAQPQKFPDNILCCMYLRSMLEDNSKNKKIKLTFDLPDVKPDRLGFWAFRKWLHAV